MQFRILGPLEVWDQGHRLELGGSQQRTLLAMLLVNANRVVSTDKLCGELWGTQLPPDVRNLLRGCVARLRRTLRGDGRAGESQRLVTRRPGYLLEVRRGELDFDSFLELEAAAREALAQDGAVGRERAARLLAEALELWRGPALADLDSVSCRAQAIRLEEHRMTTTEQRTDVDLYLGRHAQVIGELQSNVLAHPLRERQWAQLMLALYAANRQAEALAAYRRLRDILVEQLGVEPDTRLQALERAILAGDDALAVYQQAIAVRSSDVSGMPGPKSSAARTPWVTPGQLPAEVAGFTGRGQHLKQLDGLLAAETGAVVISAIAGTAGVGKTALAVHWAHQVRDRFPDGQLYVNLRGYAPAAPVSAIEALAGFLRALGVPAEQVPVEVGEAAGLYRSLLADRRVLILLDNARTAEQVRPLVPGSGGCLVLVTSRDGLGGLVARDGAHPVGLDVFTPDEAHGLLVRILGHDRVHAEPDGTAKLVEACAFLPLALRIAAAALVADPRRSIAGYVAGLVTGNRLDGLVVDGDEQTGVRATVDLSYASMVPQAQRLLRLLGLVPGPDVTVGAAAALTGTTAGQAAPLLDRLADAHLLSRHPLGRYAFHDLLRAYAIDRAEREDSTAEKAAALQRLLDWYLYTVDAAARMVYPTKLRLPVPEAKARPVPGFDEYGHALAWLDAERLNLIAAIVHSAEHGPRSIAWRLADALRGHLWLRMNMLDLTVAATAALSAAEADGDEEARAAAHLCLADAHLGRCRFPAAIEHYSRALALHQRTGWLAGQAACLNNLGVANRESARLAEAADYYERALAINRRIGRPVGEANALNNLGMVYQEQGRLELAADHFAQALAINERQALRGRSAHNLLNLAQAHLALGHLDRARNHVVRALAVHRELDNRGGEAENLRALADIHRDAGRRDEAHQAARTPLALARDIGDRRFEADALNTLASVYQCLGQHAKAVHHHRLALDLAREIDSRYPEVAALVWLAKAYQHLDQPEQAHASADQALTLARRAGYRVYEGQALTALADLHRSLNQPAAAIGYARRAIEIHRNTGHRLGHARTLLVLGHALRHTEGAEAATGPWKQALALFADIGAPEAHQVRALLDPAHPAGQTPPGDTRTDT